MRAKAHRRIGAALLLLLLAAGGTAAAGEPEPVPATPALTVCAQAAPGTAPVPGASVIVVAADGSAAASKTGADGCVRFMALAPGRYRVTVIAPGSAPADLEIDVPAEGGAVRTVGLEIARASVEEEIVIEARREQAGETRRVIEPDVARTLPGSQGDALKAVQNLPGIARASFGRAALIVRGAAPEDTRVYLDGQEIPQLYHFGGLTSVVATGMLQSIDFLPGGFGVRYGRALSGVVDVETRGAREDAWSGSADVDVYDTALFSEGPVGEDAKHGRVLAAGRRSYIDFVLPAVVPEDALSFTVAPRYYDYQLRWDAPAGASGTRTHVLAYGSDDALTFVLARPAGDSGQLRGRFLFRRLFHQAQAGIQQPLAGGWILTATPAVAWQAFVVDVGDLAALDVATARIAGRIEARGGVGERVRLLLGSEAEARTVRYDVQFSGGGEGTFLDAADEYGVGAGSLYAQSELLLGSWTLVPGIRLDGYAPAGKVSIDPRVAVRWDPDGRWFGRGYVGIHHQPPEFREWDRKVGNAALRVPYALQTGLGGGVALGARARIEGEVFWKWLDDLVVDRPGAPGDPNDRGRPTNDQIGRAYGLELLVRRELSAKAYGWIAYTLSRSERADPYTPGGWRPFEYDQTHIFTAIGGYRLPRGWELGLRMRYATGNPETFVEGALYDADGDRYVPIPGPEYGGRIPPFHQLDVRVDKGWQLRHWKIGVYLDLQNVYLRQNAEAVRYDHDYERRFYVTGLPFLPSIGIRGEF